MNFKQPKLSFKQQQQEREEDGQGKIGEREIGERKHSGKSVGFIGCRAARQSNSTAERGALHTIPKTPGIAAWLLRSLSQRQGAARLRSRAGKRSRSREKEPEQDPLTCAPARLRCTSTAEASWISLPSNTPQPASTTATLLAMVPREQRDSLESPTPL